MRCSICDYSPDTESIFFDSLTDSGFRHMTSTKHNKQDMVCHKCYNEIKSARRDFFYRDTLDQQDDDLTIIPKDLQT